MDPRLLNYYERELQHLREMGGEFAGEFPKIAGRLALDAFECADPYVERLLEGFSFLAARVQLKLDAQFPSFTQHLLDVVYPHYLAPTPSMAVVQFRPDLTEGSLAEGFPLPRDTVLRSILGKGDQTACEYRTAHDVTLWPLELTEAEYFSRDVAALDIPDVPGVRAGLRLRLRTTAGLTFDKLPLDCLPVFIRGGELSVRIYEQLLGNALAVVARPAERPAPWQEVLDASHVQSLGFEDGQALLPYGPRSFQGYRLLQEYFACPQRFLFAELTGLSAAVRRCAGKQLDLIVLFDRNDASLEGRIDAEDFALFCAPAANLFPKRADRIHLDRVSFEHHVVPDRTRPMDYEVYAVTEVIGHGTGGEQPFSPFYGVTDVAGEEEQDAFYVVRREPRVLSATQRERGPRSNYIGSEVFLSLADRSEAPYRHDLNQLAVRALCTNRDLPLHMPLGQGETDFTLEASAPVHAV
ncbi:MAG: type VI secretion system baseplate subunit TssF, partial [Planctomycetes bacterium]|nr:type VI secretion system baseplate subunit TssF [Planctomycetota bacterium]